MNYLLALSPAASQGVLALCVGIPGLVCWLVHRHVQIRAIDFEPDDRDPAELFALFVEPDDDFEIPVHDVA